MSKSYTTVIHGGERLTLRRDLETELLIVHLSTPPAVVDLNGNSLRWDEIEFIGEGSFEVRGHSGEVAFAASGGPAKPRSS